MRRESEHGKNLDFSIVQTHDCAGTRHSAVEGRNRMGAREGAIRKSDGFSSATDVRIQMDQIWNPFQRFGTDIRLPHSLAAALSSSQTQAGRRVPSPGPERKTRGLETVINHFPSRTCPFISCNSNPLLSRFLHSRKMGKNLHPHRSIAHSATSFLPPRLPPP